MMRLSAFLPSLLFAMACGAAQSAALVVPHASLEGTDGNAHSVPAHDGQRFTVLVFFSAHCDCQAVHDSRLNALARKYKPLGVAFFAVDSEVDASLGRDVQEARKRAYPYPILIDRAALFARALGAEYATYTVVLDDRGRIHYRGGIDSDLAHLQADATLYLHDALEDLLAGHEPRRAYGEALGCALQTE